MAKNVTPSNSKNLNLEKLSSEQITQTNLDNLDDANLLQLITKNKNLEKLAVKKDKKESLYKKGIKGTNESDKNFRSRIRKIRNSHIEKVIYLFSQKMENELKTAINNFDKFYKETYSLNDYSIESITRLNADDATIAKINIFLSIVRRSKSQEETKK